MTDIKEQLISKVFSPIEKAGFKAYFVGGCVRDRMLGKEPHDFDITTDAQPSDLHTIFSKFSNVSNNSEQFGVTMPLIDINGKLEEIEIATFRKDTSKGRHPTISLNASIKEDAERRDFTINAMYEDSKGDIIDPTGQGIADIKAKVLRFVGDPKERLSEDPLRAFRFVRFLAQKGFSNPYTSPEMVEMASGIDFGGVSKERKLKELKQIFAGKFFTHDSIAFQAGVDLKVWEDIGLQQIFDEMDTIEQAWRWHAEGSIFLNPEGKEEWIWEQKDFRGYTPIDHGTVLAHTLLTWKAMHGIIFEGKGIDSINVNFEDEEERFLLVLGAILHDIGKAHCQHQGTRMKSFTFDGREFTEEVPVVNEHPERGIEPAEQFCKALGMSNEEIHFICSMVAHHMEFHELQKLSDEHLWRCTAHPLFKEIMLVALADERGGIKMAGFDERGSVQDMMNDERIKDFISRGPLPKPILTGNDLIKRGRKPSPAFKKALEAAYKSQINGKVTDKGQLFRSVKNLLN